MGFETPDRVRGRLVFATGATLAALTALLLLLDPWLNVGPPGSAGASRLAGVLATAAFGGALLLLPPKSFALRMPLLLGSVLGVALILVVYTTLSAQLIFRDPARPQIREIRGFPTDALLPNVQRVRQPGESIDQLLEQAEYRPQDVWTEAALRTAALLLQGLWCALCAGLGALAGMLLGVGKALALEPPDAQPEAQPTERRAGLIRDLSGLPAPQFEELLFVLAPPPGIIPSSAAAQTIRAAALLNWAASSKDGLERVEQQLNALKH